MTLYDMQMSAGDQKRTWGQFELSFEAPRRVTRVISHLMVRSVAITMLVTLLLVSGAKSQALSIEQAFDGAMKAINEERAKNRANEFGCTQFFSDFYQVKKAEPYVAFFKSRGVQAALADVNQEHFVSFEIPYRQLRAWGYRNFYRDDRLVLVFTTTSSKPDDITSFSARLFGRVYP